MSSIDKGVEQVVNRLGRNVRVVKHGTTIYGYINNEVVFSLADRFGYINDREEQIIRDGIRRYDEEERIRRERREAERRAREEAIRRAREEAERQRREMLERERRQALSTVRTIVAEKKQEAKNALNKATSLSTEIKTAATQRQRVIASIEKLSSGLDVSALEKRSTAEERKQRAAVEQEIAKCNESIKAVERFSAQIKENSTTEEYNALAKQGRKLTIANVGGGTGYENSKFLTELTEIERGVQELLPAINRLQQLNTDNGEIGIIAREALRNISSLTIESATDLQEIARVVESRLSKITETIENNKTAEQVDRLSYLQGGIAACKKTQELVANSTYTVNDYRDEIVKKAQTALNGFRLLAQEEFTICSKVRLENVTERLAIILNEGNGDNVLAEVERLESELLEYQQADRLHASEYEEYKAIVKKLQEYGVAAEEIAAFDAKEYAQQKRELSVRLFEERRAFEKSQLIMTDMQVKSVMEEMGYEQFSTIGDAEGYVRESLFTKAGYDGVLWQVITYANGSVSRRIIGVNKGETQTEIAYVKEVAAEMEQNGDPETFIAKFREATDSKISVTEAVEHNSENVDEAIESNGFHYLQGDALKLYESKVEKIVQGKPVKSKNRQVRVIGNKAVQNSARALRAAAERSRVMAHAN